MIPSTQLAIIVTKAATVNEEKKGHDAKVNRKRRELNTTAQDAMKKKPRRRNAIIAFFISRSTANHP
jgi:hypothetical protein